MKSILALVFVALIGVVASAPALPPGISGVSGYPGYPPGLPGGFDLFQIPGFLFSIAEGIAKEFYEYGFLGAKKANQFATDLSKSMATSLASSGVLSASNAYI